MFDLTPYKIDVYHNAPLASITSFFYDTPGKIEAMTGRLDDIGPDQLMHMVKDLLSAAGYCASKYSVDLEDQIYDCIYRDLYSQILEYRISYSLIPDFMDAPEDVEDWVTEHFSDFFSDLQSLAQPITVDIKKYLKISKKGKVKPFNGECLLTVLPFNKLAEYNLDKCLESFISKYAKYKNTPVDQTQLDIIVGQLKSNEYASLHNFTTDSGLSDLVFKTDKYLQLFTKL